MRPPSIRPPDGWIYVVRWLRRDGLEVRHRYYRHRSHARAFADRLADYGIPSSTYRTEATWQETP